MTRLLYLMLALFALASPIAAQDTCLADADVNGDGLPLEVADYIMAVRYLSGDTTISVEPYHLDLNGDCVVDAGDLELLNCYFIWGLTCFDVFPVPTCCNPSVVTGACCLGSDSCSQRSADNCAAMGGTYLGDGTVCAAGACGCCELRGDVDHSGGINISDVTYFVVYLFVGGPEPPCMEEADVNADGDVNIADLTGGLIPFVFGGGFDIPPCGAVAFPSIGVYQFEEYGDDPSQGTIDTLTLLFGGSNGSYNIIGSFGGGTPEDSVIGGATSDGTMGLHNLRPLIDAGFTTQLTFSGGVWTGPIEHNTIAGPRYGTVIMRKL